MAIFGAPIAHPDHSLRAVRTALAMQEGIVELNARRLKDGKEPIAVGIGVSAGEAVAGTVGTVDRMEYTVIGDTVNLAARLESSAKRGQILISQPTYAAVCDMVDVRPLGPIRVKGKEEEVDVYEVLGLPQTCRESVAARIPCARSNDRGLAWLAAHAPRRWPRRPCPWRRPHHRPRRALSRRGVRRRPACPRLSSPRTSS